MIDYRDRNQQIAARRTPLQALAGALYNPAYNVPDPVVMNPAMYATGAATPPAGGVERLRGQDSEASFGQRATAPRRTTRTNIDPLAYGMSGYPEATATRPQAQAALTPQERAEMAVRYRQANQRAADAAKMGDRGGALEYRAERDTLGRAAIASSTYDNLNRSRTLPMSERTIKLDGSYDNADMYGGATAPNQEAIAQRLLETGMSYRGQMAEADRIAKLRAERTQFGDNMTGAMRDAALSGALAQGKMARAEGRTADMVGDYVSTDARNAEFAAKKAKAERDAAISNAEKASIPTPDDAAEMMKKEKNNALVAEKLQKYGLADPASQAEFVQSAIDSMVALEGAVDDTSDNNSKARTRLAVVVETLNDLSQIDADIARTLAAQIVNQVGENASGIASMIGAGALNALSPGSNLGFSVFGPTSAFGRRSTFARGDALAKLKKLAGIK